jgi:hypothetical protein
MHWRQSTMLSYINCTQYPCILTIWISRQQNRANRTYQFLKELYSSQFALSYTRTLLGNKRILVCSWPSVISVSYPGMQSASFLRSIILSWVPCLVVPYFSTLSHKWLDFRKNVTEYKVCVLSSSTTHVWNISHSKKNSARYYNKFKYVFTQSTRYCQILMKYFLEKVSNVMKIRHVGAE